jgi:hypothetical protein
LKLLERVLIINMSNKNNKNENKLQLLSNNKNENKNYVKYNKKQQHQQQKEIKVPTPPPLPIFNNSNNKIFTKSTHKMNSNDSIKEQSQLIKSKYKLTATAISTDDDFLAIYNQKPKIIKYVPLQGTINGSNNNSTTSIQTTNNKKITNNLQQTQNDEVIQNNAKNSYFINDSILLNIDNISQKEKIIEKLIISKQGTVRGNLNHVKLSLKQFFKENNNSNINNNNSSNNICHEKPSQLLTVNILNDF